MVFQTGLIQMARDVWQSEIGLRPAHNKIKGIAFQITVGKAVRIPPISPNAVDGWGLRVPR
jgi:hypothetical protein